MLLFEIFSTLQVPFGHDHGYSDTIRPQLLLVNKTITKTAEGFFLERVSEGLVLWVNVGLLKQSYPSIIQCFGLSILVAFLNPKVWLINACFPSRTHQSTLHLISMIQETKNLLANV